MEPTAAQTVEPTAAPTVEPMAAPTAAPLAEESVLARLIAVDRDEFAGQYWGQQPLLSPPPISAGSLSCSMRTRSTSLCRSAVCGRHSSGSPRTAQRWRQSLHLDRRRRRGNSRPGKRGQAGQDFCRRLDPGAASLASCLAARSSVLPELAGELGHPVQANAYVTPPQNQASALTTTYMTSSFCRLRREAMADTSACAGIAATRSALERPQG